jgi:itaconate CoA-transferase
MFEALGEWMGFPAYFAAYGGAPPPRSGAYHATIVPYGPFRAGDGKTVFLSIQNEREFARFCDKVLGDAALAKDARFASGPARMQNREAMHAAIEKVFAALTAAQVVERLEAAEIANARLNTLQEYWDHPQLAARARWREVGTSAGPIRAAKPPFNLSDFEPRMEAVPALGEHSRSVLAELGYGAGDIERLQREGAVRL